MMLSDITVENCLFEAVGIPVIGTRCLVNIGPSQFFTGIFFSYTTEERCFKDCVYYIQEDDTMRVWTNHYYKPIHWAGRHECIWDKCTPL